MNTDDFWAVIDVMKESNEPELELKNELEKLSPEDIILFQKNFDSLFDKAYKWDLWGAAYIIGGGCSDDGFMDFRYGLISKGKDIFESALNNPDSLADLAEEIEIPNEEFGYVASEAYEEKTNKEIPRDKTSISEPFGQEWDFDDQEENSKRLPKLTSLFS